MFICNYVMTEMVASMHMSLIQLWIYQLCITDGWQARQLPLLFNIAIANRVCKLFNVLFVVHILPVQSDLEQSLPVLAWRPWLRLEGWGQCRGLGHCYEAEIEMLAPLPNKTIYHVMPNVLCCTGI